MMGHAPGSVTGGRVRPEKRPEHVHRRSGTPARLGALRVVALLTVVAISGAVALPVGACPVCFGESDSPMAEGMNNGIFFLLAVVGMVQIGFVALFVSFRRRARREEERRTGFEVINGGRGEAR